MKNDLSSLNDYLFEQLERLNDEEELAGDKLDREIKRSKAITNISNSIVSNAKLVLDARKYQKEYGIKNINEVIMIDNKGNK